MELISSFSTLTDPRIDRTKKHPLSSIIFLTIAAVLSDADSFTEIEEFGRAKEEWLKQYVDFPHGIPSHDTIGDLFKRLCPEEFGRCFIEWVSRVSGINKQSLIHIDGKTLRGSSDNYDGKYALHLVHAYASASELLLGQLATDQKSNEITAIPELLSVIDISGSLVTIDAMGCQKAIAQKIVKQKGDYLLAVKGNQSLLEEELEATFKAVRPASTHSTLEKSHGRIERRSCTVINELDLIDEALKWSSLRSVVRVCREREELATGKKSKEYQYYICSKAITAEEANNAVRKHWSIENKLHWTMDVIFSEDASRIRKGHADENFATIRRIALNILKLNPAKKSIRAKRHRAGWDNDFLKQLLQI
jgi:predicted transposase YbfD/YdcC